MIVLLTVFGVAALAGIIVLLVGAKNAPEGFETSRGFRYGSLENQAGKGGGSRAIASRDRTGDDRVAARGGYPDSGRSNPVYSRSS